MLGVRADMIHKYIQIDYQQIIAHRIILSKKWQAVSPKVAALEEKRDEPLFIILDKNSKCFYDAENDYLTERFLLLLTQRNGY